MNWNKLEHVTYVIWTYYFTFARSCLLHTLIIKTRDFLLTKYSIALKNHVCMWLKTVPLPRHYLNRNLFIGWHEGHAQIEDVLTAYVTSLEI